MLSSFIVPQVRYTLLANLVPSVDGTKYVGVAYVMGQVVVAQGWEIGMRTVERGVRR